MTQCAKFEDHLCILLGIDLDIVFCLLSSIAHKLRCKICYVNLYSCFSIDLVKIYKNKPQIHPISFLK
jgi:hypothetical protein